MAIPEMTPSQKYEQFVTSHPQYRKMSMDKVCSIMIKQKLLSAEDAKELKKPLFGFNDSKYGINFKNSGYQSMGLNLTNRNNHPKPTNYIEKPKTYHPIITQLPVEKSGKVNLNNFTINGLKSQYDSKNYTVTKNKKGGIFVFSKKDGKLLLAVFNNFLGVSIVYKNGNKEQSVNLNKNGEIEGYSLGEYNNGTQTIVQYRNNGKYPERKYIVYPNGDKKQRNYDTKTGQIKFQDYWKKNGNSPEYSIEYSNGVPYKKQVGSKTEYILVNDLEKDITAKNGLGLPTTRPSISENVLKRITSENVLETLEKYREKTGRDLVTDIDDEIGLSKSLRDKLINHVETLYCKNAKPKDSGTYLAQKLFDDIQGLGSGKLAEHVKMINPKNLKYVLTEYRNLTGDRQVRTFQTYNELFYFGKRIGIDLSMVKGEEAVKKLAPLEGLLTAIQGEFGLKQSTRNSLIKQIVKVALEDKDSGTKSRISKDISQHPKDTYKVEVDLYRASNSADGDLRNPKLNEARLNTTKNKTFKGQVKQGRTGDCWLLAGLNSIIANSSALKQLEKQVKYDPKTGNYSVYMNGLKQTYVVTKEDLKNYTAISSGSEKVNAVEIAMDKYMRDSAYNEKGGYFHVDEKFGSVDRVTIDGNYSSILWNTLFGDNYKMRPKIDPLKEDFNNPKRLYGFSLAGRDDKRTVLGVAFSNKSKNYEIISRHAYSIVGSDEKNIYFSNPWDSSEKITISRVDFKNIGYNLDIYEFN